MPLTQDADADEPLPDPSPTTSLSPAVPGDYEPPAIVYRAPLEVTAAFCDPLAGGKTPVESCFMVINS